MVESRSKKCWRKDTLGGQRALGQGKSSSSSCGRNNRLNSESFACPRKATITAAVNSCAYIKKRYLASREDAFVARPTVAEADARIIHRISFRAPFPTDSLRKVINDHRALDSVRS